MPNPQVSKGAKRTKKNPPLKKRVSALERYVKETQELHVDDVTQVSTEVLNSAQLTQLHEIDAGDGGGQRQGNEINLFDLEFKYIINPNTAASDPNDMVRVIIFRYLQPRGVTPVASTILENTGYPMLSPYSKHYKNEFVVHYDRVHKAQSMVGGQSNVYRKYIRLPKKCIQRYDSLTGPSTNVETNGLWLMLISNESNATEGPQVSFYSRLRFLSD